MRLLILIALAASLATAGCGTDSDNGGERTGSAPAAKSARGGTITVGEESWTFVPSTQCSVYPGNVVHIAGHAAEDPSLEIVIDYSPDDGYAEARVGSDSGAGWHAMRDTLTFQIDGKHVVGSATFNVYATGTGESAQGSFEITC